MSWNIKIKNLDFVLWIHLNIFSKLCYIWEFPGYKFIICILCVSGKTISVSQGILIGLKC